MFLITNRVFARNIHLDTVEDLNKFCYPISQGMHVPKPPIIIIIEKGPLFVHKETTCWLWPWRGGGHKELPDTSEVRLNAILCSTLYQLWHRDWGSLVPTRLGLGVLILLE